LRTSSCTSRTRTIGCCRRSTQRSGTTRCSRSSTQPCSAASGRPRRSFARRADSRPSRRDTTPWMRRTRYRGGMALHFSHVDVFAPVPYSGNSVAVFPHADGLTADQMARITREMRHFESVFLTADPGSQEWVARVFDLAGELDFAGHPVMGAAAVLHAEVG